MLNNILNARIMAMVEELSVSDVISTRAEERTNYSARFAPVAVGTVKDYEGSIEWDKASVTPLELELKQKKMFAFGVDDIEALKTNPEQIDKSAKKQARNISREEDKFILNLLAKGSGKTIQREIAEPKLAYDALVDANKELSKLDAPYEDRFLIISHDFLGMIEKDARFTNNYEVLANGLVQGANVNGSQIIAVNTLPANTALAVQKDGVGFERFLDKIETMRLQNAFADGIRGLSVFDGVVLDKDFIVKIDTKVTTK